MHHPKPPADLSHKRGPCHLLCLLIVFYAVLLVNACDLRHGGSSGLGSVSSLADGGGTGDGERGAPLVLQDIEADAPVVVDIGVVDFGVEFDL